LCAFDSNKLKPVVFVSTVQETSLNAFMALGKPAWQEARQTLTRLLSKDEGRLRDDEALRQAAIIPQVNQQ
jgi:fumarylacetoacetase